MTQMLQLSDKDIIKKYFNEILQINLEEMIKKESQQRSRRYTEELNGNFRSKKLNI